MTESLLMRTLEIIFDLLTAAAGVVAIFLLLRGEPLLLLPARRTRTLHVAAGALALILVAAQVTDLSAAFSRVSTIEDVMGESADLVALCSIAFALYLRNREIHKELSSLSRAANVDHLTGLGNRSFFQRAAQRRIETYKRAGLPLACILLDIDDFKFLNDRYGHKGGDKALKCVAQMLHESTRADDLVARYGGDEFVGLWAAASKRLSRSPNACAKGLSSNAAQNTRPLCPAR